MALCWLVSPTSYLLPLTYYLKKSPRVIPGRWYSLLRNKTGGLLLKALEIRIAALAVNADGLAVIQTHHADEAFGIDLLIFMPDGDLERLDSSQGNESFHIPEGTYMNGKLMHRNAPYSVQTQKFVYNGYRIFCIFYYIGLFLELQLWLWPIITKTNA